MAATDGSAVSAVGLYPQKSFGCMKVYKCPPPFSIQICMQGCLLHVLRINSKKSISKSYFQDDFETPNLIHTKLQIFEVNSEPISFLLQIQEMHFISNLIYLCLNITNTYIFSFLKSCVEPESIISSQMIQRSRRMDTSTSTNKDIYKSTSLLSHYWKYLAFNLFFEICC